MIEYRKGNLFKDIITPAILVHGCNAQGVMGSGFAKEFKELFPRSYLNYLNRMHYKLGDVIITDEDSLVTCSAITQTYYGRDKNVVYVNYEAVRDALEKVTALAKTNPIYMPFIGGGLANGDRDTLKKIYSEVFTNSIAYIYTLD